MIGHDEIQRAVADIDDINTTHLKANPNIDGETLARWSMPSNVVTDAVDNHAREASTFAKSWFESNVGLWDDDIIVTYGFMLFMAGFALGVRVKDDDEASNE